MEKLTPESIFEKAPAKAAHFKIALASRATRDRLRILVVEDQQFSRKMLQELLRQYYTVDAAADSKEAIQLYIDYAPDITFLDIELPGENGHMLAQLFHSMDSKAYIVMVTGNNSIEDVSLAKSNQVAGYIIKPYNKQKIFECIDKYKLSHPRLSQKGRTP